jgi:hypothetical protein
MIDSGLYMVVNKSKEIHQPSNGIIRSHFVIPKGAFKIGKISRHIDYYGGFYKWWCGGEVDFCVVYKHKDEKVYSRLESAFHQKLNEYRIRRNAGGGQPIEWMFGIDPQEAKSKFLKILESEEPSMESVSFDFLTY